MLALTWRQVDFAGVALAGLVSGYVMCVAGLWAARVPGLVAIDIADFGRRYMVSDRTSAWLIGFAFHLVNSILLTFFYASVLLPNLTLPRLIIGPVWGVALALTLSGSLVAPMAGLGFMGRRTGSHQYALTNVLLHLLWGIVVALVYAPPS